MSFLIFSKQIWNRYFYPQAGNYENFGFRQYDHYSAMVVNRMAELSDFESTEN